MLTAASLAGTLALGVAIGVRHAMDADHVAAMATLVIERRSARAAALAGVWWGIGHGATVLGVGAALLALGLRVSPALGAALESAVGAMLVVLGALALAGARRGAWVPGSPAASARSAADHRRPLAIGVVHGLAGTGAVVVATVAAVPREWAIGYLVVLGLGTVAGMVALTLCMAVPFAAARGRGAAWLARGAGLASVVFGVHLLAATLPAVVA